MTILLAPTSTISEAWVSALQAAALTPRGQTSHLLMSVTHPGAEWAGVRAALDVVLAAVGEQSVTTVASTIFPADLYPVPPVAWSQNLGGAERQQIDAAADTLYADYCRLLPLLLTADGNRYGTYFQRLISYPGPQAGGFNQLAARISAIRGARKTAAQGNYFNLDLGQDGIPFEGDVYEVPQADVGDGTDASHKAGLVSLDMQEGLQLLRPQDKRSRGFPCLVHVDLTMEAGALHLFAVYRRQNLVTKAYGNLLGLSRLQAYICQQTGLAIGKLAVMATFADAEFTLGKGRVQQLIRDVGAIVDTEPEAATP
jgi:hypothetical protein